MLKIFIYYKTFIKCVLFQIQDVYNTHVYQAGLSGFCRVSSISKWEPTTLTYHLQNKT